MPPVGCCTFLTADSTTIVPDAVTAPANSNCPGRRHAKEKNQEGQSHEIKPTNRNLRVLCSRHGSHPPRPRSNWGDNAQIPP
jgi:hypothetical protein